MTSTIALRRASLIWTFTGGASLGIAGGVIAHLSQSKSIRPDAMLSEVKESLPGKAIVEDIVSARDSTAAAGKVLAGKDVRQD